MIQWVFIIAILIFFPSLMAYSNESTATKNVIVLNELLPITKLKRERQIRIYLPPDYATESGNYPVLYMHDGQNLFDERTSFVGEWQVDEALNELFETLKFRLIVVGIDNDQHKRRNEYSPWSNEKYGAAEGMEYVDFIVNTVKPFIDNKYRTLDDSENTAIMGSSLGGLISHYSIFAYPEIFGKAGIYSPSYWFTDAVFDYTSKHSHKLSPKHRIELLGGTKEGGRMMVEHIKKMGQIIIDNRPTSIQLRITIVDGGEHNEAFWSQQFSNTIKYLFNLGNI